MIEMELTKLLVKSGFLGGVVIAAIMFGAVAIGLLAAYLAMMRLDMKVMEERLNELERGEQEDKHGA